MHREIAASCVSPTSHHGANFLDFRALFCLPMTLIAAAQGFSFSGLRGNATARRRRIEEAVAAVGDRELVIASADCGFGTFTRREWVIEPVVWLKLGSIRAGADIASTRLWGRKVA